MNFLFWNVRRNPIPDIVAGLVLDHDIDVVALAEPWRGCSGLRESLTSANDHGQPFRLHNSPVPPRAMLWSRLPDEAVRCHAQGPRHDVWSVMLSPTEGILVAVAHLQSRLRASERSQAQACCDLARDLEYAENLAGHRRTVLVGDLNVDPFHDGVIGASGLHATMDRAIAVGASRSVNGVARSFFYNPMWSRLGDEQHPPATYFYRDGQHVSQFWYMFDQVLVRPELLGSFRTEDVVIATTSRGVSLQDRSGRPNKRVASDHFPIVFRVREQGEASSWE